MKRRGFLGLLGLLGLGTGTAAKVEAAPSPQPIKLDAGLELARLKKELTGTIEFVAGAKAETEDPLIVPQRWIAEKLQKSEHPGLQPTPDEFTDEQAQEILDDWITDAIAKTDRLTLETLRDLLPDPPEDVEPPTRLSLKTIRELEEMIVAAIPQDYRFKLLEQGPESMLIRAGLQINTFIRDDKGSHEGQKHLSDWVLDAKEVYGILEEKAERTRRVLRIKGTMPPSKVDSYSPSMIEVFDQTAEDLAAVLIQLPPDEQANFFDALKQHNPATLCLLKHKLEGLRNNAQA